MNKYFEYEEEIKLTKEWTQLYQEKIKNLNKKLETIKDLCDHTNKDGSSSITKEHDGGHGHIIYTCSICGRWGDRNWLEKIFNSISKS